jgi:hypothetical protein
MSFVTSKTYCRKIIHGTLCLGSGELVDDVERHGCHDIFWCYPFEREISRVVNISSNQKTSEVTYTDYYAR